MILARDKLREAQFFLDKLIERGETGAEFRYYLSAFSSAARSVTLVLQAELRPKYGDEFSSWYDGHRKALGDDRMGQVVKEVRNTLLKEGSREPVYIWTWRNPAGCDSVTVSFTVDQLGRDEISELRLVIDRDHFPLTVEIERDVPVERQLEQIRLEVRQQLDSMFPAILERAFSRDVQPEILISVVGQKAMPMQDLVADFQAYVDKLTRILDEAEGRFP
jgi:hypothetical protein